MIKFSQWVNEVMVTPETMATNMNVRILNIGEDRIFKLSNGKQDLGKLKLRRMPDDLWCPHTDVNQNLAKGYGPLLYDLGIEYATVFGRGVMPATGFADL